MSETLPLITSSCVAHIDLKALQHNYTLLNKRIPQGATGMAIIKNDAYGHGLLPAAKALEAAGATFFGVGTAHEGKALRQAGFEQEILVLLGAYNEEELSICAKHKLIVHVYSPQNLALAAKVANEDAPLYVAIKCETGMSRLGFSPEDMSHALDILKAQPHLHVNLACTHISCADMPEKEQFVRSQVQTFVQMTEELIMAYPQVRLSLCNSAASLAHSELSQGIGANIYRFGIALYGGNPFYHTSWQAKGKGLRETMRVSAKVLHIYEAKAGQCISYGATFTAKQHMRVAVLGIGYADGFSRGLSHGNADHAPTRTVVSINGQAAPLCGRVCMGTMMVDISHIAHVQEGQDAWIVDASIAEGQFSMQALSDTWGTIPYEGFCLLGKNTRIYNS